MNRLGHGAARAACLLTLALAAGACQAASDHERQVGAQVEQLCDPRALAAVGRFLQVEHFQEPPLGQAPDANAMVAASACSGAPAYHGKLVAAAYRSGHEDDLLLVVAVVEAATGQVGANFKANLDSDPAVRIVSGSLWLDTTAYELAPGVRAFGLDITSGLPRGCAAGGSGARRSLFVSQGRFIRPVMQDLPMSEWNLIQRGRSSCTDSGAPELTITENFATTLAVATSTTRGYHDLAVSGLATRDDGRVDERLPFHALLKWDGRVYSLEAQQQAWATWKQ